MDQCRSGDVLGGSHRGIVVKVFESLDGCPGRMRDQLQIVHDAIVKELSGRTKKLIWGKKTVGLMSVRFTDDSKLAIAAISGTGINEWTLKEVDFNNSKLERLKQALARKNIVLADLTYEHDEYRRLAEQEAEDVDHRSDVIPPKHRKDFANEYTKRLKNKVEGLKKVKASREDITAALEKSAMHRPSLHVPYYMQLANDITVVEWCRLLSEQFLGTPYIAVIRFIEKVLSCVYMEPPDYLQGIRVLIDYVL